MDSKSDILKDAPQEIMATYAILTLLWDEKYHNDDDWNRLIPEEDVEMVYRDRDKAQVTESLKFLVDNAYITVNNNEKKDVVGIMMYSRQLDENVLGNILKHIHT
ncbi:MAG TPA: hypothetical protein VER14_01165 [Phototrophicaceae bacterium]|nr:hypothetical protein [Phototrophicaceae bacterium]